ncbi:aspartate dehydrogenase domain-containing protein-like [Centruroides vittatus]|uniref:aspartate dehydrogenase domain-containing protein-like n=1 Tax=Centruroides vittatus TaxID=120091 RepID=UPI00350FFBC0
MEARRVGIVGYGHLGRFLYRSLRDSNNFRVAFVWNRTPCALEDVDENLVLRELSDFHSRPADVIVEVAHPDITAKHGSDFVAVSDYVIGSPTALADPEVESRLRTAAIQHGVYVPSGALWGGEDLQKLAETNMLEFAKITMRKHPSSIKLTGELKKRNEAVIDRPVVLYEGPVREICKMAPNNTNTMATAAIAAHNLGMDGVMGCLVADPSLEKHHVVEVEARGPLVDGERFTVHTIRKNPATRGAVTGMATYNAFLASLHRATSKGPGIHLC